MNLNRIAVALVLALALFWISGCDGRDGPELVEVPAPDTGTLEPMVREQVDTAREIVEGEGAGDPAAWGHLGLTYHGYEYLLEAEAAYVNASRLAPEEARWPYLRGRALESLGRNEEAVAELARAVELDPDRVSAHVSRARVARELGRVEEARGSARAALALEPRHPEALLLAGRVELEAGDAEEAVRYLENLFVTQPQAAPVARLLALAYRDWGRPELAEEIIARGTSGPFDSGDPLDADLEVIRRDLQSEFEKGLVAAADEDMEAAANAFIAVLAQNPDDLLARMNLGTIRARQGRPDQARLAFEEILRRDPEHLDARLNLGTLEARTGNDEAALAELRKARELAPDDPRVRFALGGTLYRLGRCEEAMPEYRQAIASDPAFEQARLGLVVCQLELGRHEDAARELESSLEVMPRSFGVRALQARLLAAAPEAGLRDGDRALELARALVAENRSLEHLEVWAMALAETGDFERAAEVQRDLLEEARQSGRADLVPRLERNLTAYQTGRPTRDPRV